MLPMMRSAIAEWGDDADDPFSMSDDGTRSTRA
jgi:hypothetical protein